jgi:hypothetical protein
MRPLSRRSPVGRNIATFHLTDKGPVGGPSPVGRNIGMFHARVTTRTWNVPRSMRAG